LLVVGSADALEGHQRGISDGLVDGWIFHTQTVP
jgi:hypothetical protein